MRFSWGTGETGMEGRGRGRGWRGMEGACQGGWRAPLHPGFLSQQAAVTTGHARMSEGVISVLTHPIGGKVSKPVHHLEEKRPSSPVSWPINVGTCFAQLQASDGTCRCLRTV